jgi:predicted SnoaL-like aldol condensation-catalyzing enzyme
MSEENKAIVRRMIDELLNGQGNLDVADELFAPEYVGHNPASPVDTRGPEGVKEFASMFRSAFPDVHFSVEDQTSS